MYFPRINNRYVLMPATLGLLCLDTEAAAEVASEILDSVMPIGSTVTVHHHDDGPAIGQAGWHGAPGTACCVLGTGAEYHYREDMAAWERGAVVMSAPSTWDAD
jgi:hypothetical protein